MTTKLALYKAALTEIGERAIATLSENREPRRVLDAVYDAAVADCIEAGQWHFAMRTVQVDSSDALTLPFGYAYAFDKPEDWVRTAGISTSETFDPPLTDYSDETDYWMAHVDPLYVRFVSNDTEFGLDLGRWPPGFTRYVVLNLASRICERITQNGTKAEMIRRDLEKAKRNALAKDAMSGPTKFLPTGRLVMARLGNGGRARRYDRA